MKTVIRDITIVNKCGLHARPSAFFAKTASQFKSDILVELEDRSANGKSMMGLMILEASYGKVLHITTTGDDAEELMNAVEDIIKTFVAED